MPNDAGKKPVVHTKKHIARLERERRQTRLVLYLFIGIVLAVLLLLGYGFLDINYLQLKKPVAKVGNVEIISEKFEARVRLQRYQLLAQYGQYAQYQQLFGMDFSSQLQQIQTQLDDSTGLGQTVLDQMIKEELIRQESAKRGITVSDKELQDNLQGIFNFYPNGSPTPTVTPTQVILPSPPAEAFQVVTMTPLPSATPEFTLTPTFTLVPPLETTTGTPGTLVPTATLEPSPTATATLPPTETPTVGPTETITPTATAYTVEGFQTRFDKTIKEFSRFGLTEADYRELIKVQLLQTKLQDAIVADVPTSEEEVWARHILVKDEATAKIVLDKLKNGEDFASLAVQYSQDTGSAKNGGDLGWFGKGAMVPEFETAAFALKKPGDYTTTPVKSQFGYHIIQLIAKQTRPLTADAVSKARTTAFDDWVTKARTDYGVVTYDFWKTQVPTEPNFTSIATESVLTADAASTATAKAPTGTPTP